MLLEEIYSTILLEDAGTLKKLHLGKMFDLLKQPRGYSHRWKSYSSEPIEKKIFRGHVANGITNKSPVVDGGVIKNGIGGLRKAYKAHPTCQAFALYVDNTAIVFGIFDQDALGGSSRQGLLAYDLSPFKAAIDKEAEERKKAEPKYYSREYKPRDISSAFSKENHSWRETPTIGKYAGKDVTTGELKSFLEDLIKLSDGKPITCKLVLADTTLMATRSQRLKNADNGEKFTGLEDLQKRLKNYKISKKPTASDIRSFIEMVMKGPAKVIQFAGEGYSSTPKNPYGDSGKLTPLQILAGTPFEVKYESQSPGSHHSVTISYKLDKDSGMLKAFKAEWTENHNTKTHALDPTLYLKHELRVQKLSKEEILKSILSDIKANALYKAEDKIKACKEGGYDYPELATIEKTIAAEKK